VCARRGALIRRTDLTPEAKVQSTRVRSTPFQRRLGLATLHLDVAGTDAVRVLDRAAPEAAALGAQLGSQALAPT
jgi:putative membrane protein